MEEQRAKEALVLVRKKHKLIKMKSERERARTMQRLEVTNTASPWSGGQECSSFGSCSSSFAPNTDEAIRRLQKRRKRWTRQFWKSHGPHQQKKKNETGGASISEVNWSSWRQEVAGCQLKGNSMDP